jgi:hypothetical protein
MKQTLHIFLKDVRRFWIEIVISIGTTACYAWADPKVWLDRGNGNWQSLDQLLTYLLVPTWWLLIGRVLHAESLVGDRQFWITRPYEWKKLLAAKILFLICFLNMPIFLAHWYILAVSGFNPSQLLNGLLYKQGLIVCVLLLPAVAIASVTSNLTRMTLTILGILLVFAGFIVFSMLRVPVNGPHNAFSPIGRGAALFQFCYIALFVVIIPLAVIVLQYATRRTPLTRGVLIAAVILFFVAPTDRIASSMSPIDRVYPMPANGAQQSLTIVAAGKPSVLNQSYNGPATIAYVELPLQISGVEANEAWTVDGVQVTIQNAQGKTWNLPWQSTLGSHLAPFTVKPEIDFYASRKIVSEIGTNPVQLKIDFALTQNLQASEWQGSVSEQNFSVPGFGICSYETAFFNDLTCRIPLGEPVLTHFQTSWSSGSCDDASNANGLIAAGWFGESEPAPASFGLSSVDEMGISLSNGPLNSNDLKARHMCPGTPITVRQYRPSQKTRREIVISGFQFPAEIVFGKKS